ncbi:hypothetical protein D5018_20810 [Parashewanella curva]|uniref:Replication initiation factor n=1 Tax=Parashewanella curva TaxID=2338552 RepID=A0A3L8PTN4_9GAMM|nr:hypothetical protein [Parashewanella curva]RLV57768.1 hypothetical protein D5018_20810 [Parashewanella curva]
MSTQLKLESINLEYTEKLNGDKSVIDTCEKQSANEELGNAPKYLEEFSVDTDQLTLLFDIKTDTKKLIDQRFGRLANCLLNIYKNQEDNYSLKQLIKSDSNYTAAIMFPINFDSGAKIHGNSGVPYLHISIKPNGNRAYLRVEFKGFPYTNEQLLSIRVILSFLLGKQYESYMSKARVSSIHIACDILGMRPDYLVFDKLRSQKGKIYFGKDGKIESIYLGEHKASSHVLIYDLNAKAQSSGETEPTDQVMRVECRYKFKKSDLIQFSNVAAITDMFGQISGYDIPSMVESEYFSPDFIDAITGKGLIPILQKRSQKEKSEIQEKMKVFQVHWFRQGKIFSEWQRSLEKFEVLTKPIGEKLEGVYEELKNEFKMSLPKKSKKTRKFKK